MFGTEEVGCTLNALCPTKREMAVMTGVDIVKSQILTGDFAVVQQLPILESKRKFEKKATHTSYLIV